MFVSFLVFLPRVSLLFYLFLRQVSQSYSQDWNIFLPLILLFCLFFFSLSTPPLSSLVDGLCRCLFVVPLQGNSAYTLGKHTFCNHYQLISHSLWVSFSLIAALVLVMLTAASYSHADPQIPSNTATK